MASESLCGGGWASIVGLLEWCHLKFTVSMGFNGDSLLAGSGDGLVTNISCIYLNFTI